MKGKGEKDAKVQMEEEIVGEKGKEKMKEMGKGWMLH